MKKKNTLENLGLSANDVLIYEHLLKHGALSPTELAAYTKFNRPSVYSSIRTLLDMNLVVESPFGKRSKYTALPPKQLKNLLHTQEEQIQKEIIRLEEITPPVMGIPKVVVLSGRNALRTIYEQIMRELKKGDVYYRYQAVDGDTLKSGGYMSQSARLLRNAKEIERYVITNAKNKSKIASHPNRLVKVLPDKYALFEQGVGQIIFGNKTAIIDYNSESATVIESESISNFQKAVFKSLFNYI
jgi:predicted transcriptional regulator